MNIFRLYPNCAFGFVAAVAMTCLALTATPSRAAAQPQATSPVPISDISKPLTTVKTGKAPAQPDLAISSKQEPQSKPSWAELTPAQQASLRPLSANWSNLSEAHKRKWIALSQNYPKMSQSDQARLHGRMTEWVILSPQQRAQARFNFAETQKLTAVEKAATWQAYQALSPEEKKRLANQGNAIPPGATSAIKPVPGQKLAVIPSTRKDPKPAQIAAHQQKVSPNTLLPHQPSHDEQTSTPKH